MNVFKEKRKSGTEGMRGGGREAGQIRAEKRRRKLWWRTRRTETISVSTQSETRSRRGWDRESDTAEKNDSKKRRKKEVKMKTEEESVKMELRWIGAGTRETQLRGAEGAPTRMHLMEEENDTKKAGGSKRAEEKSRGWRTHTHTLIQLKKLYIHYIQYSLA